MFLCFDGKGENAEADLLVPDCRCKRLSGAETLVRVKVSSPGFGTPDPVFTSRCDRIVIGADLSERMSQNPDPTPCRDFREPQLQKQRVKFLNIFAI